MAIFDGKFILNVESKTVVTTHVTIEEVKHNLYLLETETVDDEFITSLIAAAAADAESYTGFNFNENEYVFKGYNFSGTLLTFQETPLLDISLIRISDDGSTWNTIADTEYYVDSTNVRFNIGFKDAISAPFFEVTFKSGFLDGTLPPNARRAIILKASDMYDIERGTYSVKNQNNDTYINLLNAFYITRW